MIAFLLLFLNKTNSLVGQNIQFTESLTWNDVINEAKLTNKYIFVDCYTTWCGPCKRMESDVYTDKNVIKFANENFISLKIQIDSTNNDNDLIKKKYDMAYYISKNYGVHAFPMYLFFSPLGEIVDKDLGYKNKDEFFNILKNATNINLQYYTAIKKMDSSKLPNIHLKNIAYKAGRLKEEKNSRRAARMYIDKYLNKISEDDFSSDIDFKFIKDFGFLITSRDRIFKMMYSNLNKPDTVSYHATLKDAVLNIISNEEMDSFIKFKSGNTEIIPNWSTISKRITRKYDKIVSDEIILKGKIEWYGLKSDWTNLARASIEKINKYGLDTIGNGKAILADMIYNVIFLHCLDKEILSNGLTLIEIVVKASPNDFASIDTYANILYKLGRKDEAILWEAKAMAMDQENAIIRKREPDKIYKETLDKMTNGIPTWPLK